MLGVRSYRKDRQFIRRLLAGVLLAIILGSAAHHHNTAGLTSFSRASIDCSNDANSSSAAIQTDCSICKLHSQLSVSLIRTVAPVELSFAKIDFGPAASLGYRSQQALPPCGRAPPLTSPV
jgi:hypothetical protein